MTSIKLFDFDTQSHSPNIFLSQFILSILLISSKFSCPTRIIFLPSFSCIVKAVARSSLAVTSYTLHGEVRY